MKCYVHHDIDAVDVCVTPAQGTCDACAVRIGGRIYCKSDAGKVFGAPARGAVITIASISSVPRGLQH
jgi:hypothetical protein